MARNGLIGPTVVSSARVLGRLAYTPAYILGGKQYNQKCEVPFRVNQEDRQGNKKEFDFRVTAWNGLADTMARFANPGKEFDLILEMQQFEKQIFSPPVNGAPGLPRLDQAGVPITIKHFVGWRMLDFEFGNDSAKFVSEAIATGRRRPNWAVQGHPDHAEFLRINSFLKRVIWDGRSNMFLNADVRIPKLQGLQLIDPRATTKVVNPITEAQFMAEANFQAPPQQAPVQQAAPVYAQAQAPVYGQAPLVNQVAAALPPVQGGFVQPLNGGYTAPAQQAPPVYAAAGGASAPPAFNGF